MSEHTESAEPFRSWEARGQAAASIVTEAAGFARAMPVDDEWLLLWAREYLPRIVALADRGVAEHAAPENSTVSQLAEEGSFRNVTQAATS